MKLAALPILLACAAAAWSQDSATAAAQLEENVLYATVNGTELHLDVYKPVARAEKHPAVVLIHGGGWTDLDKSTMRTMGQFLARFGYVGFAPDYRLFQPGDGGNRWPAQLEDVERAVRWIRANGAKYGVNSDRIGAFGHSAGAQLAALLGMPSAVKDSSSRVQAVVDVSGPTDFTIGRDSDDAPFLSKFFAGDYAKNAAAWQDASPVFHVAKDDAPFLIVHGTQDQSVPIAHAEELFARLKDAGVPVSFVKVDDAHTFRTPDARRRLAIETLAFFNQYLGNKP